MTVPFAYHKHEDLQSKLALYWSALKEAGHDPSTREVLGVYHLSLPIPTRRPTRLPPRISASIGNSSARSTRSRSSPRTTRSTRAAYSKLFGNATYDDLDKADCVIFGTPERCVQRLKRAQQDYGLNYSVFEVNFGGLPHKEALKSMEKFAKYVMPHFK